MACYLDLLSLPSLNWGRQRPASTPLAAGYLPQLERVLAEATHLLILISDDAIEGFLAENESRLQGKTVVHCSGSLVTSKAQGAHPLMTFTERTYTLSVYTKMPFVVERGPKEFQELLPGLPNHHFYLEPEQKSLYHALCVLSGNFTSLLWSKFFRAFEDSLGLPREAGYPYMDQIFRNLKDSSVEPVTGPLVRRDWGTIRRNLEALSQDPYRHVYEGFLEALELRGNGRGD